MPKHVAGLSSIDQENGRTAGGRERAPNLKIEARIAVALCVQCEYPRQLSRRTEEKDAWRERECPQVLTGQFVVNNSLARIPYAERASAWA